MEASMSGAALAQCILPKEANMLQFANPLVMVWVIFAGIVLVLLINRFLLTVHEDTSIHTHAAEQSLAERQAGIAHRLELIDYWGKLLTIVTLLYGLGIAGAYLYLAWQIYPK
jgi:hypothetical protein